MELGLWTIVLLFIAIFLPSSPGQHLESFCETNPDGTSIHDFVIQRLDGSGVKLSSVRNKAVLVVNVASF